MMFTTHKTLSCSSTLLLSSSMVLSHSSYLPSPFRARDNVRTAGGPNAAVERVVTEIGILHGNNMASNRQYHVVAQYIKQFIDLHLTGPDANGLIETIWAIADRRWANAAKLLSTASTQANFTSHGGTNLLGDLLIIEHHVELVPHFADLALETGVCGTNHSSSRPPMNVPEDYRQYFSTIVTPSDVPKSASKVSAASEQESFSSIRRDKGPGFDDDSDLFSTERHHRHYTQWEIDLHCTYAVYVTLHRSLVAVNLARYKVGVSTLAIDIRQIIASFLQSSQDENSAFAQIHDPMTSDRTNFMGAYENGDEDAMQMLQYRLGSEGVKDFQWESSGAVFLMQQQHLADSLRKSIDQCK